MSTTALNWLGSRLRLQCCSSSSPGRCKRVKASAHPLFGPLYLALGVGFLTIAIPLKLESYWNTLGWLVEGGSAFLGSASQRDACCCAFSACWRISARRLHRLIAVDSFGHEPLLINPRFGLYLLAIGHWPCWLISPATKEARPTASGPERRSSASTSWRCWPSTSR